MPRKSKRGKSARNPATTSSLPPSPPPPLSSSRPVEVADLHQFVNNIARFGLPEIRISRNQSAAGRDRVILSFGESPHETVEVPFPSDVPSSANMSDKEAEDLLTGVLHKIFTSMMGLGDTAHEEEATALFSEFMRRGEIKNARQIEESQQAEVNFDVTNTAKSPNQEQSSSQHVRLVPFVDISEFLEDTDTDSPLGKPILRVMPDTSSSDPDDPERCQFTLAYSHDPDASMYLCLGHGTLDKLLTDDAFKKHINDQVRKVTRHISRGGAGLPEWKHTEYVVGIDGEPGSVLERDGPTHQSGHNKANDNDEDRHNKPAAAFPSTSNTLKILPLPNPISSLRPDQILPCFESAINSTRPYPCLLSEDIQTALRGKYAEYGEPSFRKVFDRVSGSSRVKLRFAKVPHFRVYLACASSHGIDILPPGLTEDDVTDELKKEIRELLLEYVDTASGDATEAESEGQKVGRGMPGGFPDDSADRDKDTSTTATSIEEIDQEIEAIALQKKYWTCYSGEANTTDRDDSTTSVTIDVEQINQEIEAVAVQKKYWGFQCDGRT